LVVMPRAMPPAPRRYVVAVPRPTPAAARMNLAVVLWHAAPLVAHRINLIAALGRCPRRC
jgi:hypothetical protein